MSGVGDLNTRVRRPSVAGANTQILLNYGGVEGASANLTFNVASNTLSTLNLNVSSVANTVTLNVTQSIFAPNCPMSNITTGVETGIGGVMVGNSSRTSTTTLAFENNLSCTLGNTGVYAIECLLCVSSSNGVNGLNGINIAFGGTATVNSLAFGAFGVMNGGTFVSPMKRGITNTGVFVSNNGISTSDWLLIKGVLTVNTTGTFVPMYAQIVSNANNTNLQSNSYMTLTRIA